MSRSLILVLLVAAGVFMHDVSGKVCSEEGGLFEEGSFLYDVVKMNYQKTYPMSTTPKVQCLHLSVNGSDYMDVQWLNPTKWSTNISFTAACLYGVSASKLTHNVSGHSFSYTAGGFLWTLNMASMDLTALNSPSGLFYYQCGDPQFGWSPVFNFTLQSKTAPSGGKKVALVGDWGVTNGEHTMASITKRVNTGEVQLIVHEGDISYANKYSKEALNNSYIWVAYMNAMQSMASRVPYMVSPGNHESQFKFAAYLNWLIMPTKKSGSTSPFWYSFDYMGVHYVSFSTEHDFSPNSTQHQWIEQDLKAANQNRKKVPWIIVFGHRPLYCTSIVCTSRCDVQAPVYRKNLEGLLWQQKVDVFMSGHNHQYERSYPVYKSNKTQDNYVNPTAPVYIVNGAAGCPEMNDPTFKPSVPWRAFDEPTFETGYLLMEPTQNELKFQYIFSRSDRVKDSFSITRTQQH